MIDKILIKEKLSDITDYLEKLAKIAEISLAEFISSNIHYEAERFVEIIVGDALDINFHLIKEKNLEVPKRYKDSFLVLGKTKVISYELAQKIADSAGLRNILIHHYDDLDLDKFYRGLKDGIADYREYVKQILKLVT